MFDPHEIRKDFPVLQQEINGRRLVYLDNAATTQLPLQVLQRLEGHYTHDNGNVHRGIHTLSERSTEAFENARKAVSNFIGGGKGNVIFTSGTTASINMVAGGLREYIKPGSRIIVTQMEHHSNLLPWQRLSRECGAELVVIPCPDGEPDMSFYAKSLSKNTAIVSAAHVTNLTGTVMPVSEMAEMAHKSGALMLVDGAQGIRHSDTTMDDLGCDYYCFSGHKLMAPSGIGVLWGKDEALELLDPFMSGGGMVDDVYEEHFTVGPLPSRLEAGTPNYSGAIALGEAVGYIASIGRSEAAAWEDQLLNEVERRLSEIPDIRILGHPRRRAGVISFVIDGLHPYDVASIMDKYGFAIRSGTHCAIPALRSLGYSSALRVSPAFYNLTEEIDAFCDALNNTTVMLRRWMNI